MGKFVQSFEAVAEETGAIRFRSEKQESRARDMIEGAASSGGERILRIIRQIPDGSIILQVIFYHEGLPLGYPAVLGPRGGVTKFGFEAWLERRVK